MGVWVVRCLTRDGDNGVLLQRSARFPSDTHADVPHLPARDDQGVSPTDRSWERLEIFANTGLNAVSAGARAVHLRHRLRNLAGAGQHRGGERQTPTY